MKAQKLTYLCLLWLALFFLPTIPGQAQAGCTDDQQRPTPFCQTSNLNIPAHPTQGAIVTPSIIDLGSLDDCTAADQLIFRLEFAADFSGMPPESETLVLPDLAIHSVNMWVGDRAGNWDWCTTVVQADDVVSAVDGQVFIDNNQNCLLDEEEGHTPLSSWTIQATNLNTGATYSTQTQANGSYSLLIADLPVGESADISVEVLLPPGLSSACPSTQVLSNNIDGLNELNFPINLRTDCQLLTVDIGTALLRRCFSNSYTINYCNYSSEPVYDAEIIVQLDELLLFESASEDYEALGGQQYRFRLDSIPAGGCGRFTIQALASCELMLGQSQCVSATISPADCQTPGEEWSGASLTVSGSCDEDEGKVRFEIRNVGDNPLITPLAYTVVEDVVMYRSGTLEGLGPAESRVYEFPANGATWLFSIDQPKGHPGKSAPIAFVEGCGGFSPGIVNQFRQNDADPYVSIDCQTVVGSFDPNDKQAFPVGVTDAHYIEPNREIEYLIRFQNTGTDTAFTVVIEDQLSPALDHSTFLAGSSSHAYRTELSETGLLRIYFENILLPDSLVNEPASHGFIKFKVNQLPDNPPGTLIDNTASIYFDFNEAIITNRVRHQVEINFLEVRTATVDLPPRASLQISPNPMTHTGRFQFLNYEVEKGQFLLLNAQGQIVIQEAVRGNNFELNGRDLPAGLYLYQILDKQQLIANGKLVIK
ncbi:DUF7619 domain-containing protein [Flavilitoribacter nigricans]|uniref:DUF7619 domain-containing protein n=1 Tax=Flavilitoribacter nigricans (strain ATCC 23147 / DSM 23189 / NBRC 102662 / NCIMB 1420 / SS-2) TaxID=1122177 RepID=A0A2D0NBY6_FLAN2|nr:T9SS type A sorting domain-containing protein [Flavilitoribacter nigricans]PHN06021.1 hypothetical protein CRP01_13710 [Flavilitoribacter nigricans DSM 23189 = NBRC 102662]